MWFDLAGPIEDVEVIAVGRSIRVLPVLRKRYGPGRWKKMKGTARVRLKDGTIRLAELRWYEAHGIGKKELKFSRYRDQDNET